MERHAGWIIQAEVGLGPSQLERYGDDAGSVPAYAFRSAILLQCVHDLCAGCSTKLFGKMTEEIAEGTGLSELDSRLWRWMVAHVGPYFDFLYGKPRLFEKILKFTCADAMRHALRGFGVTTVRLA